MGGCVAITLQTVFKGRREAGPTRPHPPKHGGSGGGWGGGGGRPGLGASPSQDGMLGSQWEPVWTGNIQDGTRAACQRLHASITRVTCCGDQLL